MDWTGGLTLKIIFMLSNETHSPDLCAVLFLAIHGRRANYSIGPYSEGLCTQCVMAFSSMTSVDNLSSVPRTRDEVCSLFQLSLHHNLANTVCCNTHKCIIIY